MCTNGIEYYCGHYVHNTKRLWKKKKKKKKKKINRVNTMTTIETISWSKTKIGVGRMLKKKPHIVKIN